MVASDIYTKLYIAKSSAFRKDLEKYAQRVSEFLNSQGYKLKRDHEYSRYKYVSTELPVDIGIKAFLMLEVCHFNITPESLRLNYRESRNAYKLIQNPHPFIYKKVMSAYKKDLVPDAITLSFAEKPHRYSSKRRIIVDLVFYSDYFPYF